MLLTLNHRIGGIERVSAHFSSIHLGNVWTGASQVYDRKHISDFIKVDVEKVGGYLVNFLDVMIQDQSVNNT